MDDSVLVRFAKLCCQNGEGNLTRIWAFLHLTDSHTEIGNETLAIARETRATENTLFFAGCVEVKGTFAIGGAGGAAVEV
mgnify:CR=1 FL=1